MKQYNRFSLTLLLVSVCVAALSVISRIFLTNEFLDRHGVYMREAVLPTIYHILLAVAVLVLAAVPIIIGRKISDQSFIRTTNLTIFTACISAFMLAAYLFLAVYGISKADVSPKIVDTLELIFTVPTIIFFFITALQKGSRTTTLALVSLLPCVWAALGVIKIYFNLEILMNNPDKILGEFALIAAMLFFLVESRNQIGIPLNGLYQAAVLVAPILLLTASIPNLVCADKLGDGSALSLVRYMSYFAIALFMYSRALAYAALPSQNENIN